MHLFDSDTGASSAGNAIVGGGIPVAVGLALADKLKAGRDSRYRLLLRGRRHRPKANSTSR